MTIHEAQQQLLFQLYHIYDDREAAAIANLVMENITEWKRIDRVLNKNVPLSLPKTELLKRYTEELSAHKPVQYVLHEAWFAGMKFYVDENVLIPRPETEELVEWIVREVQHSDSAVSSPMTDNRQPLTVLDVGTGSGCIPIALKKKLPGAEIFSCDVSEAALYVAKKNAQENNTEINFLHIDFLKEEQRDQLPIVDIIVSNPPYIPLTEKITMQQNVIGYEPHLALFVEDDNALMFYEAIAAFAKTKLKPRGTVYVEIHEELAPHVKKLFSFSGFQQVEIKKDMQGKDRMIKATMLL
ncbi:MAG TPA: peptide chain release factor N(5)-glutamine methyltransferase [Puia sp.]|nr:peptide chain release factor N(5)-glutamine methyltransferase [Puia sp.]